jgi:hypothetical protein
VLFLDIGASENPAYFVIVNRVGRQLVLGIALYAISALIEQKVTGWAHRKTDFAIA